MRRPGRHYSCSTGLRPRRPGLAASALFLLALLFTSAAQPALAQAVRTIDILYLDREDDLHYRLQLGYTGTQRRVQTSPFPAAELALRDTEAAMRAAGLRLTLTRRSLKPGEQAEAVLASVSAEAAILDLPYAETERVAKAAAGRPVALFNARHREVELREAACRTNLFHTLPTWAMLTDALAQTLAFQNWRRAMLLEGPSESDRLYGLSFVRSMRKFGLSLANRRSFYAGTDPRQRDQTSVRMLTGGAEYDVVAVADILGELGRTVAYQTALPRPVVGTVGLVAAAWHPFWERHGAPQLNRRFHRANSRPMTDEDWATWVAVRAVSDAATLSAGEAPLLKRLLDPTLKVETYKGVPGSFRPWSRQLRQAVLVGTHDTVVTLAPIEGSQHRSNGLDMLGSDESEFRCVAG